jgi:hypothetical protein
MNPLRRTRVYLPRTLLGLALTVASLNAADQPMISVLTIQTDNVVTYVGDITDPSRLALLSGPTTPSATRAFTESITVGDVVSINGRPAKGLWQTRSLSMGYSPTAAPGSAIADSAEGAPGECKWAILTADGILVGRFQEGGLGVHQITGGSGLYLGMRPERWHTRACRRCIGRCDCGGHHVVCIRARICCSNRRGFGGAQKTLAASLMSWSGTRDLRYSSM